MGWLVVLNVGEIEEGESRRGKIIGCYEEGIDVFGERIKFWRCRVI